MIAGLPKSEIFEKNDFKKTLEWRLWVVSDFFVLGYG